MPPDATGPVVERVRRVDLSHDENNVAEVYQLGFAIGVIRLEGGSAEIAAVHSDQTVDELIK